MHLLAHVTGMDVSSLANGHVSDDEWDRMLKYMPRLVDSDFSVAHVPYVSTSQILSWLDRACKESRKPPYVVIDDSRLLTECSANAFPCFDAAYERMCRISSDYSAAILLVEYHHIQ
jgi:replicative DNA helicase